MSGSAIVLVPAAPASLYDLEDNLQALLNSEDTVSPEQEEEYRAAVAAAMTASVEKRNRMYQFLRHLDASTKVISEEIKKLQSRQKLFANTEKRVREYIIRVIESLGPDAKGKPVKLTCDMCTFSLRNKAEHVLVDDAGEVPAEFKTIAVKLPLETWRMLLDATYDANATPQDLEFQLHEQLQQAEARGTISVDEALVKTALLSGISVPGADIEMGEVTLVIR